ncbi:tRNA pseudouridine synthase [Perkinsela sp. CCAP 1560/4]|nr:tRNA pseudouridine synthase [Perkinsela sp. CCAP 1560/4]|eukprot:KNH09758.1 tRNA pseudouridine synthase [Perkinsela sp. CCAP 1560/4]
MSRKKKVEKELDFERYNERKIVLSIAYLGHGFGGLAFQRDNMNTIEESLFDALRRTKLCRFKLLPEQKLNLGKSTTQIPEGFSRCGRTDSDVSAFSNAVTLHVRSQLGPNSDEHNSLNCQIGLKSFVRLGSRVSKSRGYSDSDEIDYIYLLNKLLPPSIRITSWSPVQASFDARHSCISRSYRYYFFPGEYDLDTMREACASFIGLHNFINFCKKDALVTSYWRRIESFEIVQTASSNSGLHENTDMCGVAYFSVSGNAFLHHQIRYMVSLLFQIGSKRLHPSVIDKYLNSDIAIQNKEFCLASAENLCFWECKFSPNHALSWNYSFKGRNLPDGPNQTILAIRSEKGAERYLGKTTQKTSIQDPVDSGFVKLFKKALIRFIVLHEMDMAIKKREEEHFLTEKSRNLSMRDVAHSSYTPL